MTLSPSKREFDIDFFRGWVCLSLTVLHFFNSDLYNSFFRLFGETGKYVVWNFRLGVESFFVLAGFMMAHMLRPVPGENVSITGYVKRRFFRLILPYWIAVLIFTLYRWGIRLALNAQNAPSLTDVLAQLFLVQEFVITDHEVLEKVTPVGYWSMVTLEQFYLLWLGFFAISLMVFGRSQGTGYGKAERAMAFLTFALCLGSLSMWAWTNVTIPGTTFGWRTPGGRFELGPEGHSYAVQLPLYTVFLALGMLLYWAMRQKVLRAYFVVAMILLLAAACFTNQSRLWKALLVATLFVPLAHGFRMPDNKFFRFLAFCGKRSYSIYLIHAIVGIAFIKLVARFAAKSDWLAIPIALGAIVISVLASMVFYRHVELPCQAKSRTVEYRTKRTSSGEDRALASERQALPVA